MRLTCNQTGQVGLNGVKPNNQTCPRLRSGIQNLNWIRHHSPKKPGNSRCLSSPIMVRKTNVSTYDYVNLGEIYKGIELRLKAYGDNVEKLFCVARRRS